MKTILEKKKTKATTNHNAAEKDSTKARNYKLHNQILLSSSQPRLESLPRIENQE